MIVYGKQIVFYILDKYPQLIQEIYLTKDIDKKVFKKFMDIGVKIIRPDNKKAQALARGGNHQGFLLRINEFQYTPIEQLKEQEFLVVLDGLTDIGNIGAIVRTSYALGVDGIVIAGLKNPLAAPIIRTSSGTMLDMDIALVKNSFDLANELKQKGFSLVGADATGYDIKTVSRDKKQKIALFLGNEGSGLTKRLIKKLDLKVAIPMEHDFDSLNVSVAAGILIHSLK